MAMMPEQTDVATRRSMIVEDATAQTFRVHRAAFRDAQVFQRELERFWGQLWLYVGHESEIPNPGDYKVRTVGGRPLIFCRDTSGVVRVYLNACPHRGTTLCRDNEGNTRFFRCFYHGWTFSNEGQLVALPGDDAYPDNSDFRERLGLRTVPRTDTIRDFVFVSYDPDVEDLRSYLGEAADFIELTADQSAERMEIVPGTHLYCVHGNWKLAVENAIDIYHFGPTHITFTEYLKDTGYVTSDAGGLCHVLGNGHTVQVQAGHGGKVGLDWEPRFGEAERVRIEHKWPELVGRLGEERATKVAKAFRILYVFPNLFIFDIEGITIRQLEPVAPGMTNVTGWQLAPADEDAESRALRIKILGTFSGPGGLATPDDIEAYEAIQRGIGATAGDPRPGVDWNDISRGISSEIPGAPSRSTDETGIRAFWRHWDRLVNIES